MSFGFGSGGGFGQNNQQQQTNAFGGFGANNTTTPAFGSTATTSGFGASNNSGGGLFGNTSSGFGNNGGFGTANTNTGFGAAKPAFGAPAATTSLFGSTPAANTSTTSAFGGGFGMNNNTTSAFGGNTGATMFGAKPATTGFGAPAATTGFGSPAATTGFGAAPTTSAFGFGNNNASTMGGNVGECQGTGAVPFQAFQEKEPNSTSNQQNAFQSICFQQPYQKFSHEELRLADYAQGRRSGNGTAGATGAFGTSNFGGFGTSNNTGFGATNNTGTTTSGLFGQTTAPAQTGFGQPAASATGGFGAGSTGMFGQAAPSAFGSNATAAPAGGSIFGGAASTGFGAPSTANTGFGANTGSNMFGNNAAAKPAFSFPSTSTAPTGAFGQAAAPAAGAFGTNTGFGSGQTQASSSPFGQNTTQPSTNAFGGFGAASGTQQSATSSSIFGAAKPAAPAFGNSTTTGSTSNLFGGNNQAASNPFQTGTSAFGQAKPTTGLFGNAGANNTGTFGGFNNNAQPQTQQNTNSLFGSLNTNNNNQPAQNTGLFNTSGTSNNLFGNNNAQTGNLFNNSTNQTQQPQMNNSIFGSNSIAAQQQGLTASINDPAAFGISLLSNNNNTQVSDPGPIATPLSSLSKQKKPGVIPMYKLNPAASSSRFSTPGSKRGFGFSYSSYGTPGSSSSSLTNSPLNMGGSILGASVSGNRLTQSMSMGNMRSSMGPFNSREDSILAPGAFSASPISRGGTTGSMKKLVINRGIRTDLFQPPSSDPSLTGSPGSRQGILKKRVSFDPRADESNGQNTSPPKQSNGAPSAEEMGYLRSSTRGDKTQDQRTDEPEKDTSDDGASRPEESKSPEMEQIKGNEVAVIAEDDQSTEDLSSNKAGIYNRSDQEPGEYWMIPTRKDIEAMNRVQRQKVTNFTIGRKGVGKVIFMVPVDLTTINMDDLFDKDVCLEVRSATVYPNSATKPPVGKGLNVPSKIELENSWPRFKDKRPVGHKESEMKLKKHIDRLSRVPGTQFVDYNKQNGTWIFTVEHFTRYGIEYSDDDEVEGNTDFEESVLSAPFDTPTTSSKNSTSIVRNESYISSSEVDESSPEDTFNFKKKKALPGAFDEQGAFIVEDDEHELMSEDDGQSFLDDRSMGSQSENGIEEPMDQDDDTFKGHELVRIEDESPDDLSIPHATMELVENSPTSHIKSSTRFGTQDLIQRAKDRVQKAGTPSKRSVYANDDWTSLLQLTCSPLKKDRKHLRQIAELNGDDVTNNQEVDSSQTKNSKIINEEGFTTSIDLMRSLYGESTRSPAKSTKVFPDSKGFQWPYQKGDKNSGPNMSNMDDMDRAYHNSLRPSWGSDRTLVYAAEGSATDLTKSAHRRAQERDGLLVVSKMNIVSARRDIRLASFSDEPPADYLSKQKDLTTITSVNSVPVAKIPRPFSLRDFSSTLISLDPVNSHEKLVWELASILFDDIKVPAELTDFTNATARLRKDKFSEFWQRLVDQASHRDAAMAKSSEEKAIACLTGHKVAEACKYLLEGNDFHLASLVSLIGENDRTKQDIRDQLSEWKKSKMLSEISQPVRTLYELLAGNVCVCDGTKEGPLEDRMDSYRISQRHGLDWRQAFGLRLWYAISVHDSLEIAIQRFSEELQNDKETARPQPWYIEQGVKPIWDDPLQSSREDLLWGLLKLYANPDSDLEAILRPENSQLSPLNVRLSWQLSRALTAFDQAAYGNDDAAKSDALTLDFASQLVSEGNWLDAVFVLIHLTSPTSRTHAIQQHLAVHASKIGGEEDEAFQTLTRQLYVPAAWIWEAKALYMRQTLHNPIKETQYLLKAGSYNEAHRTFVKIVAPQAVVEYDYDTLRTIIDGFKGNTLSVKDWHVGGEVYDDYLVLLFNAKSGDVNFGTDGTINRLFTSLQAMANKPEIGFMENVAVQEMSAVVSKVIIGSGKKLKSSPHFSKVLNLPLLEDQQLKYTSQLSVAYYKAVMAGNR